MKHALTILAGLVLSSCANRVSCKSCLPAQAVLHQSGGPVWTASDGRTQLPCFEELPPNGATLRGVVIVVPGLDGTLADYQSPARALAGHGYIVSGYEHRTMRFDPLEKRRGTAHDWRLWVRDLQKFATDTRKQHPGLPLYYHGHSFGTIVVLQAVAESLTDPALRPAVPDGLVLQSPAIALLRDKANPLLDALSWPLEWIRIPHLAWMEKSGLELTACRCWDCAWMRSENRVKKGYSIAWFRQALRIGHKARLFSETGAMPETLVLWGRKDYVTLGGKPGSFGAEKQDDYETYLNNRLARGKAIVRCYEDGRHLLTEGPGKDRVIRDVIAWLDAQ